MSTLNPRINISFNQETLDLLNTLAKEEKRSLAGLAKELILDALERREDLALTRLAEKRDHTSTKWVKHADVWK